MIHEKHYGFDSLQEAPSCRQLLLPFKPLYMVHISMVLVSPYQMTLGRITYIVEVEGIPDHPPQNFSQFYVDLQISSVEFFPSVDFSLEIL